jgi:hypothetical protein
VLLLQRDVPGYNDEAPVPTADEKLDPERVEFFARRRRQGASSGFCLMAEESSATLPESPWRSWCHTSPRTREGADTDRATMGGRRPPIVAPDNFSLLLLLCLVVVVAFVFRISDDDKPTAAAAASASQKQKAERFD